ncbi:choice-of-anchor L domain-containing protein [Oscillatoria sp. CS-180]|nr:choice-of-anchor L domain-containing protein [Oscillatoria sp. CS-180]
MPSTVLPTIYAAIDFDGDTLDAALADTLETLETWAQSTALEELLTRFDQGSATDVEALRSLHTAWQNGDFSQLPRLEILPATDLAGANGAFAQDTQTIYLAADWVESTNPSTLTRVLIEEIGHFVDAQVNAADTAGDEGALFAAQVQGLPLSASQLAAIQSENDHITLQVDGQTVTAEAMTPYEGDNLNAFQAGLADFLTNLETTLDEVVYGQNLPLIGSALASVSDEAVDFVAQLREAIAAELDAITPADLTPAALEQALNDALGEAGLDWLDGSIALTETADSLSFNLSLSREALQVTGAELTLAETVPGIDISGETQVNVDFNWNLQMGLDSEGFFVNTDESNELSLGLSASVSDLSAVGPLGAFQIGGEDSGGALTLGVAVDLDGENATATLSGESGASLDIALATPDLPVLPTIGTTLALDWTLEAGEAWDAQTLIPVIAFNDVSIDVGSLLGGMLGPFFEGMGTVLDPLDPFLSTLNYEFPLIKKSAIELLPGLVQAFGGNFNPESAEFANVLTTLTTVLTAIDAVDVDGQQIILGDVGYDLGELSFEGDPLDATDTLGSLAGIDLGGGTGLEFPLLSDPTSAVQLLLGEPVDLLALELPTLAFGVSATTEFPIPAFPPISITLTKSFEAAANVGFGLDSSGLQDYIQSVSDGTPNPELIANGFYINTPEIDQEFDLINDNDFLVGVAFAVDVGGKLRLGPAYIEPRIGIVPQLFLDLNGQGEDNRVPIPDLADSCFLTPSGKFDLRFSIIGGFGFRRFAVERSLFKKRVTIADFSAGCPATASDEDHQQATVGEGGATELTVGDDAADILQGIDQEGIDEDEFIIVSHVAGEAGNETIAVEAYGATWDYPGVTSITADAESGDDVIDLTGVLTGATLHGGSGFDELYGGEGDDELNGEGDRDVLQGGGGNDILNGGTEGDFLEGGAGNDTLNGDSGRDSVSYAGAPNSVVVNLADQSQNDDGEGGQDTLNSIEQIIGSEFGDTITGGDGNVEGVGDVILGGGGNDILNGGGGDDFILGGAGADIIDGGAGDKDGTSYMESTAGVYVDLLSGNVFSGGGSDADGDVLTNIEGVQGSQMSDVLLGDENNNELGGAGDDDLLLGGGGEDILDGGLGIDTAWYIDSPEMKDAPDGITGVIVSLAATDGYDSGYGERGHAEGDRLLMVLEEDGETPTDRNSIENLVGSFFNDKLTGDDYANELRGGLGDDQLNGNGGSDRLIGGAGADKQDGGDNRDWVDYSESAFSVVVDLNGEGIGGDAQGDTYISIENIQGSDHADILWGNSASNDIAPGRTSNDNIDRVNGGDEADDGGDRLILNHQNESGLFGGYNYDQGSTSSGEFINQVEFDNIERLQVVGSQSSDIIRGGAGDDEIHTGMGNDTVFTGQGNNYVTADAGDDTVIHFNDAFGEVFYTPDADADVTYWIDGGAGIDTFSGNLAYDDTDVVLTGLNPNVESNDQFFFAGNGSAIYGFERFEQVQTSGGNDQLTQLGRVENDFRTGAGDDIVNTGLGLDYADGGIDGFSSGEHAIYGDDLLVVDYSVGDTGEGLQSEVSNSPLIISRYYRNAANDTPWDEVEFLNFERVHVDGTQHDDTIMGLVGNDELRGHDGNDFMMGGRGDDELRGGSGNDVIIDNIREGGTGGSDRLLGDDGDDFLVGGDGNDDLDGGAGNDIILGIEWGAPAFPANAEIDTMTGGTGADIFLLGDGASTYYVGDDAASDDEPTGTIDDFQVLPNPDADITDIKIKDGPESNGSQHRAIVTDFSLEEGDAITLHGSASDYMLQAGDGFTHIVYTADGNSDIVGTLQGVTGLELASDAFHFFDDDADPQNLDLLLSARQSAQAMGDKHIPILDFVLRGVDASETVDIDDLQVDPADPQQIGLLLPAIQKVREAAASETFPIDDLQIGTDTEAQASAINFIYQDYRKLRDQEKEQQSLLTEDESLIGNEAIAATPAVAEAAPASEPSATLDPTSDHAELAGAGTFSISQTNNTNSLLNTILGDTTGLTILETQVEGDTRAFGTFQYDPMGLGSGFVMSTGDVTHLVGPNGEEGGFVGNADIPLTFTKLGSGPGFTETVGTRQAASSPVNAIANVELNPNATPASTIDDVVANPANPPETAVFRANLSDLQQLQSLTIADSGSGAGGAGGERTGFDLVGVKISNVLIDDAASIDDIPGLDLFDFSPLSTYFTPGEQRPSSNPNFPETADMFGSLHGNVNNAIATLGEFDFDGDTGFISLGDGGSVGFDLTQALDFNNLSETLGLDPDSPLYLYVGEAGNNGESLTGQITASAQRINGQTELSTDFGLPGAEDDTTRFSVSFEADDSVEQLFLRFAVGSEEFVESSGSDFNDTFSIKLNGFNLARLSDGSEVNINNLVPNPFGDYHPDFIHNPVGTGPASNETPLDGYTQVLTFTGAVNPNAVNHLEIEVKDVGDGWKDSAIFLEAGSLGVSETPLGSIDLFGSGEVREGDGSVLNLKLNTMPTETVTVTLDPDEQIDLGNGAGNPLDVIFTPEDALINRQLMFTAVDDTLVEDFIHFGFITATAQSIDPSYGSLEAQTIEQMIVDNDEPSIEGRDPVGRDPITRGGQPDDLSTVELTDIDFNRGAIALPEQPSLVSDSLTELAVSILPTSPSIVEI